MNIYLDANVLITVLNKEYPDFSNCARVLSLTENTKFKLFTSPLCLGIAWYFSSKKSGETLAKKKINQLVNHLSITVDDETTVKKSLSNPKIKDIEDGFGYYSAIQSKCKCIVTANKKDFYFSEIEVLNAEEFLEKYFFRRG